MKRLKNSSLLVLVIGLGLASCQSSPNKYIEDAAIADLDAIAENIGDLTACSFTITVAESKMENGELMETVKKTDAYLNGPKQMFFYTTMKNGERRGVWYNQDELSIFLFNKNQYQTIPAPKSIIQAIDSINSNLNFEFPAADFFYPTLADDVIDFADSIFYLGPRELEGVGFAEILAKNSARNIFILVDEETNLPKQLEIYDATRDRGGSYVATFSNWRSNPELPEELFLFIAPEGAVETSIIK